MSDIVPLRPPSQTGNPFADAVCDDQADAEFDALKARYEGALDVFSVFNETDEQRADREAKAAATLVARAALAGFELVKLADGTFLVARWGMFRGLADTAAVEQFLQRVGAPAA